MDSNLKNLLNNFVNGKYIITNLSRNTYNYNFYIASKRILEESEITPLHYEDIIDEISNTPYIDVYLELMNKIRVDKLYKSYIHGINHNIRVSIFALIISIYEDISLDDFKIVIEAAKYHDIGRKGDNEDKEHGLIGSRNTNFLNNEYTNEELKYLKTIIQCHCLNDNLFENVAKENGIENIERCRKMFSILKDSDGLDRARLEYPYIKIELLRTNTAKKLIPFAYELVESYKDNLEVNINE